MILLHSFPADLDLTSITQALWQHKIPHRVRFLKDEQQVWLQDSAQIGAAQKLIQQVFQGTAKEENSSVGMGNSALSLNNAKAWFTLSPITIMIFVITVLVAFLSQFGSHLQTVAWFSFFPLIFDTQAYLVTGYEHLWQQPWRLISPVLLHFGWLHVVFNLLWWLDLGRRIERQSRLLLIMLLVLTSLAGNVAQAWQEASLFGGLSGVIYGLLGYIWVIDRFNAPRYHLPQSILVFMLLWLLLGMSGLFSVVGFGSIANMAHLGGLVAGVLCGFLHTLLWRIQPISR
jgi:GlpG protein